MSDGRSPSGSGYSPKGGATSCTASPAEPSIPNAVNDGRSWTGQDDWFVCRCGCSEFLVKRDAATGWNHLICKRCESDHTMTLFGDASG